MAKYKYVSSTWKEIRIGKNWHFINCKGKENEAERWQKVCM